MENYQPETYGERIASVYDVWYPSAEEPSIPFLAQLAHGGRALELGIGSGRIAVPLKKLGVDIQGIDASPSMVGLLHKKPNGVAIPVTIGDFSQIAIDGSFELVFVAFNTFYALTTQELQLKCMENVAHHLTDGGSFVIEAFVPDIGRFIAGQTIRTTNIGENEVKIDVSQHNPMLQQVVSQHVVLTEKGIKMYPVTIRYTWPSELDMMARAAHLKLKNRWEDWGNTAFSSRSGRHISVYGHI